MKTSLLSSSLKENLIVKIPYLTILLILFISCKNNVKKTEIKDTFIQFENLVHDFGELQKNESLHTDFKFTNTGSNPLFIQHIKSSCGCTVPELSKKMILPKETGAIKVTYDAEYPGFFSKTIMVNYNGENSPVKLTIRGRIAFPEKNEAVVDE